MPFPESGVQTVNKSIPPFFKGPVRLGHLQTAAGLLRLCLCGFSIERKGKGKVSIEPFHGPHSVQAQQAGGEVNGVPTHVTHPAAEAALVEAHGGVLVIVEGAQRPAPAVKGQAIVPGCVLGAYPFPDFAEIVSQGQRPFRLPALSA